MNLGAGTPMAVPMRRRLERSFGTNLRSVRVHSDAGARMAANRLGAKAFAFGPHIVLGPRASADDVELMGHEAAHTIQQGSAPVLQPFSPGSGDAHEREARRAGEAAARGESFSVSGRTSIRPQRWSLNPLDYIAQKANFIPGFRMFTIVLGVNPVNMSPVARSAANILRALIELIPGGGLIARALDSSGVFEKAGAFVEGQIKSLGMAASAIKQALSNFIASLGLSDLGNLDGAWERAKRIFTEPIVRIISFASGLVSGIVELIKDAILRPIAQLAEGTSGYALLKAVLGRDPITGESVPRTAENLIGPFMTLIGQQEIWENMKKAKAVPRAFAWFQTALAGLMGFANAIPGKFVAAFRSLQLEDIILVPLAFGKLVKVFAGVVGEFTSWAGAAIWNLLEIIFSVVAPGVMPYIAKARAAFRTILKSPGTFVGYLVRAGRLGFEMFAGNFVSHLKAALIKWITGPLGDAGVYIPKAFTLMEIIKLVLSVLGLTWQNIRSKLVKIIPEPVLTGLEKTTAILVTLVRDGPAAAWEQIKAELEELKGQLIGEVTQMIAVEVVKAAVVKLVSMLNPVGAFVQAILAIYNTITFFIEKINQIAAVVASFIDSIAAIAAGQIGGAAKRVEQTMANTLTVVIAFLARFAGLGNIPKKVVGVVKKIRRPIDKGLDRIVAWLGNLLKKAGSALKSGAKALLQWWKKKVPFRGGGESHTVLFQGEKDSAQVMVRSTPKKPAEFVLDYVPANGSKTEMAQVKSLSTEIEALKKSVAAAQKKEPPNEVAITTLDEKLTAKFNALGQVLAGLLDKAEDEGSEKNPVPAEEYPKRRAGAYPNIYVGPATAHHLSQARLKAAAGAGDRQKAKDLLAGLEPKLRKEDGFKTWSGTVMVFRAAGGPGQSLPAGGVVGLDPAFAGLAPGKVLVYDEKGSTGGGSKINNQFKPFGFRPGKEGMDGDHVMERQLGGPDAIINLWPLQAGENRSSGSTVKRMKVTFNGKSMTVHEARQKRKKKPLHLLIKSVR